MALFEDDEDREVYLGRWGSEVRERGWRAHAYCLMDNHVHHLVEIPRADLAAGIREVHKSYAIYLNRRYGREGHAFQGRYGCSVPADADGVRYVACYVALNPVRAGLCATPHAYRWSSHAAAIGSVERPTWLDVRGLLARFGGRRDYLKFLAAVQLLGMAAPLTPAR